MVMLVIFLFTAILCKLVYVTVAKGEELQVKALEQWYRDVPIVAERGRITDRDGVVFAQCETVYTLYCRPIACTNKEYTAKVLAEKLELKYEATLQKISSRSSEVTIKKNLDKNTVLSIVNSGTTGLFISESIKRVYPYGDFLTQLIGFTNVDCAGQTGIEAYYDKYLTGVNGYVLTESDLVGRVLQDGATYYQTGTKGGDACLTIDYEVQAIAENAIKNCQLNTNAKSVSTIIMNPNTGEILAMARTPSFDLNAVPRDNVAELMSLSRVNLVSDVFEPGSTFKIVTSAIGLDSGAIDLNYRCFCGGALVVDGQRIKCWRTIGHGSQSFVEGVQNSCNCLFMNIALAVGVERFYEGIRAFGLTSKTGIDVSGEASGLTIKESDVKTVDLARIGFGQAIAVTPIELLRACAAVVNGGNLVTPYVMDKIIGSGGQVLYQGSPIIKSGVIKESTSKAMREVLETVVLTGSGKGAKVEGLRIGGKTGTAQKYANGAIARGKYVSTFVGFAPADKPEYIALIVVDEPVGAYYGGIVAAPYVGQMFKNIFEA